LKLYLDRVQGMSRRTALSPQTIAVLRLLTEAPDRWWHGYDVARRTGLKSGTLYPILMRLHERGLLDAEWEEDPPSGRPRRHRYRLTGEGVAVTESLPKEVARRGQAVRPADSGSAAAALG
jgi:PadR family transcriptional regulator, regulatory protein PadR